MILCIDIGGTKTEVATLSPRGRLRHSLRFPTPRTKTDFLDILIQTINKNFRVSKFTAISIAIPGPVKPGATKPLYLDNLPWRDLDIVTPIKKLFKLPTFIANDSKLAALHETRHLRSRAVYLTLSTGIGAAVTVRGRPDPAFHTYEPGHDRIINEGLDAKARHIHKPIEWEDLASAKAISTLYARPVTEIHDPTALTEIARRISLGLIPLIESTRPKIIIFDGPLGRILPRYRPYLTPLLPRPARLIKLHPTRTTHAVIYGCYLHARRNLK